ncbi:MAG: DctP family TRAP transporter solute-binding subunit [Tabrizicola sp.]|nr:DctP family TRAP transporter solute-binding subunit [Tabrizicola sp.]
MTAVKGHPKGEAALAFATAINRKFQGKYCVVVYGDSELFKDDYTLFEAMKRGEVTFAAPSVDVLNKFTPKSTLFSLPFLFDSPLHALAFTDSDVAQSILADFADDGFHAFGFWSGGMRQMSATVPIRSVRDAEGLTFRVSSDSPVTAAVYEAMGVKTIEMPFAEVYDALASGKVQGQENTWSNIDTRGFYKVQAAVTETNHNYLGYVTLTTTAFLDSLPEAERKVFVDTMRLVSHERNGFAFELNQLSRQAIIEDGGVIISLSKEELAGFRAAFKPVFDRFKGQIGAELVDQAIAINATTKPFE